MDYECSSQSCDECEEPLPKRVRQSSHSDLSGGQEERSLHPYHYQLEQHGTKKWQSPARELKGTLSHQSEQQVVENQSSLQQTPNTEIKGVFGTSKPLLKDLICLKVTPTKWYDLGLQLNISDNELDKIEEKHSADIDSCKRKMFQIWLRNTPDATYTELKDALDRIGEHSVAAQLLQPSVPVEMISSAVMPLLLQSTAQQHITSLHVPQEVEHYRTFLIASYECVKTTEDQWPPVQFQKYIKLATVLKVEDFMKEDDCTKAMMKGNLEFIKRMKQPIEMEKIGRFEDGTLASCIIVEGIPGVGKSTLAWQLGRRWGKKEILQHFQLVIVLRLRDERVQKAHTISKLFYHPDPDIPKSVSKWMATTLGDNVLLILDGYDELSSELQIGDRSIFARIIKGVELPKLTVLVTSRPSANRNLHQLCKILEKCQYIEVVGFGEEEIREYIEHAFKHNLELKEQFLMYIEQRPHIHSLMYVPINCAIVAELFREHKGKPPETLTEVYTALTNILLQRHEHKTKEKTPGDMTLTDDPMKKHYSDLVCAIQDPAGLAGSLYSRRIISQSVRDEVQQRGDLTTKRRNEVLINAVEAQVTTDLSMFQVFMEVLKEEPSLSTIVERMSGLAVTSSNMTCFESLSSTTLSQLQSVAKLAYKGTLNDQLIFHDEKDNIESLGLLQKVPQLYSTSSPKASYNFLHKTLQEFLTAWYVSSLPTLEQRVFVKDSITKPNMAMTVRFMAGLTKFQTPSNSIDGLADISFETTDEMRLVEKLHWMFETQNPTFIQRLMGNKEQTFKCINTRLNPFDLYVLGYCIANSSSLWSVKSSYRDLTDECMRMLFMVEDGKAFHHITSLYLAGNTITTPTASLLGMMLKENNTLKELKLINCGLQPEGLEEVIKGVQVNTKLETLNLSFNTIDNKSASCLGMMLKENKTLKILYLSECGLQPEGLEEVIKGVQVNTKLETLVLQGNTFDNKSASCLAHVLEHNTTLSHLKLWDCGLKDEAICELCGGLKWCKLKTLDLGDNPFGDQGAKGLSDVLKDHPTLEELDVYDCKEMSDDGVQYLMDAMMSNTRVKELTLSVKYKHLVPHQLLGRIKFISLQNMK